MNYNHTETKILKLYDKAFKIFVKLHQHLSVVRGITSNYEAILYHIYQHTINDIDIYQSIEV